MDKLSKSQYYAGETKSKYGQNFQKRKKKKTKTTTIRNQKSGDFLENS